MPNKDDRVITVNRKAYHDYTILETVEAGIALKGSEIKSIRAGQVQLRDSYARPDQGELWLYNSHVAQYAAASYMGHEPERARKLLLHKKQVRILAGKLVQKGLTLVPLKLYIKRGRAKLELGLAEGKRQYDKREVIARRDSDREIDRAMKSRR
jgi:SsrA-binding protein